MNKPFSIVAIVKGSTGQLSGLINSIEQSQAIPEELILVWMTPPNNESLLSSDKFTIHHKFATDASLPISRARIKGFTACATDTVVYLDADCICSPTLLGSMIDAAIPGNVITANIVQLDSQVDSINMNMLTNIASQRQSSRELLPMNAFTTTAFAISKSDYTEVGGFDPDYQGYGIGDVDFGMRCSAGNLRLVRIEDCIFQAFRPHYQPPINHLCDIVSNAELFKNKWGVYPDVPFIADFVDAGFINADYRDSGMRILRLPTQEEIEKCLVESTATLQRPA